MDRFPTPDGTQQSELIIKRSRFITSVGSVIGRQAARGFIDQCRERWPDANHHCWAMVAGTPDDIWLQDQSDDGEPRGTAGKPMLNVLQHAGLGHVVMVVTRYFGGVKLGAGGLVRAYSQSATQALATLSTKQSFIRESVRVEIPYSALDALEHWLRETDVLIEDRQFEQSVQLSLLVPMNDMTELQDKLRSTFGSRLIDS